MGVGKVIRRLRKRKKLSQDMLAEKAGGMSGGNISDIETKDRTPRFDTLKRIAEVLETTPEAILKKAGEILPERPQNEIIAEALHIDPEIWESLSDEEKEFILRDAREKAEFFRKKR